MKDATSAVPAVPAVPLASASPPAFSGRSAPEVDWAALPTPTDDGAADHLRGLALPALPLSSTGGGTVDLAALPGLTIVFCYPMTGRPGHPLPAGWDMIPGARGCTNQSCAFRDAYGDLIAAGVNAVFGLSAQSTDWQGEAKTRLGLPYDLLSDETGAFAAALRLPNFEVAGERLLKRLTFIARHGVIDAVVYPVFPPDEDARSVLAILSGPASG